MHTTVLYIFIRHLGGARARRVAYYIRRPRIIQYGIYTYYVQPNTPVCFVHTYSILTPLHPPSRKPHLSSKSSPAQSSPIQPSHQSRPSILHMYTTLQPGRLPMVAGLNWRSFFPRAALCTAKVPTGSHGGWARRYGKREKVRWKVPFPGVTGVS